jgi:hypothetical protein
MCVAGFGCLVGSSSSLFTGSMFAMEGLGRAATSAAETAQNLSTLNGSTPKQFKE